MPPPVQLETARALPAQKVYDASWKSHFAQLRAFGKKYGHCRVPHNWPKNQRLAEWVGYQRHCRYNGKLTPERRAKLESIGFCWNAMRVPARSQLAWDARYAQLAKFQKRFGHCLVPIREPGYYTLHRWMVTQRSAYNRGELATQRFDKLDRLGFSWKSQKRRAK